MSGLASRLRGLVVDNFAMKAVSLGAALALYALAHGAQDAQRTVNVDLVVVLPPEGANRVLVSSLPPHVRVTLRGSRAALDDLRADDLGNLQIDAHTGQDRRVAIERGMIHVPAGVRVEQVDPPIVEFSWEDVVARDVPVQVSVAGTPASGYVVRGVPHAEPRVLRIRGSKSDVSTLQFVRADPFDVTGLTEGAYARSLALDRVPAHVTLDTRAVNVTTEIARELAERAFTRVPVVVTGQARGRAQPAEVDVRLACPPEVAHALRPEQVVARVAVPSTLPTGSEALPVQVAIERCEAKLTPGTVVVRW